jgi:hypothetical protein
MIQATMMILMSVRKQLAFFKIFNISLISQFSEEKRAILNFLQDGENANEFLDQSRRLFSDQKSQMKEAKKK